MEYVIRPFRAIEKSLGFEELIKEYVEETAYPSRGTPSIDREAYRMQSILGDIKCIGVYDGEVLAGLSFVRCMRDLHYPVPVAVTDSFYLRKPWRKGAAGLRLLRETLNVAREFGAPGLLVHAPVGSSLDTLCGLLGMAHTHNMWWCNVSKKE